MTGDPGAPVAPVAPVEPALGTEEYFSSGRLRVIGMITAGVVLVGVLGGLAGIAFDPDPVDRPVVTPVTPEPGAAAGQHRLVGSPANLAAADAQALAAPRGRGKFLRLGSGVSFWVPRGWKVDHGSRTSVFLSDRKGSYAFIATGKVNPRARAGDLITHNLGSLLPPDNYTQLEINGPLPWGQPFGAVLSTAFLEYSSLWVDNQGSAPIYGQIYAGVRRDGMALVIMVEHIPPEGWEATVEPRSSIVSNSFGRFGGVL